MVGPLLEKLGLKKGNQETSLPTIEEAIKVWEENVERNPQGYKIVRGTDGRPVEIVLEKSGKTPTFAILVNGEKQEQFQIGGEMQPLEQALGNLTFKQFLKSNIFNGWYELRGVQRLDAKVGKMHQGFVFGMPGEQPTELPVRFK